MILLFLQYFGGRGNSGKSGGRAPSKGAPSPSKSTPVEAKPARDTPYVEPIIQIEERINEIESRIAFLQQREKDLFSQIGKLSRANNFEQLRINNRKVERGHP